MRHVANTLFIGLAFGTAALLAPACFNPPAEPVQFACEPDDAAECPDGYECRVDGCCHREDTPDDDALGACKFGVASAGGPPPPGVTTSSTTDATAGTDSTGGATDATGDTGGTASTGTTSTGSSTAPQTTGAT